MPQTETIANELTERLNQMISDGFTDFDIAMSKRDAEKLLPVNAALAYDALGMIAALTMDFSESIKNHRRALNLVPDSTVLNTNFAISLDRLGASNESIYFLERAMNFGTPDVEGSPRASQELCLFEFCVKAGRIAKALNLVEDIVEFETDEEEERVKALTESANKIHDYMVKYALSDNDVSHYVGKLEKIAAQHSIACESEEPFVHEDDEGGVVICFHKTAVSNDPQSAVDLNEELLRKIAFEEPLPNQVTDTVSCSFLAGCA